MGITEHRAISSKVSADGIGIIGAMADCRGWWGLGSDVGNCFKDMKDIQKFCRWARGLPFGVFQAQEQLQCDQNVQQRCRSLAVNSESEKSKITLLATSLI